MSEDEQIIQCALAQARREIPYGGRHSASIYERKEEYGPDLVIQGKRWYVEILQDSIPSALYRVWISEEGPKALRTAIMPEAFFANYGIGGLSL